MYRSGKKKGPCATEHTKTRRDYPLFTFLPLSRVALRSPTSWYPTHIFLVSWGIPALRRHFRRPAAAAAAGYVHSAVAGAFEAAGPSAVGRRSRPSAVGRRPSGSGERARARARVREEGRRERGGFELPPDVASVGNRAAASG